MEEGAYGLEQCMLFARSDNQMIWHSLKWLKSDWLAVTSVSWHSGDARAIIYDWLAFANKILVISCVLWLDFHYG